MPIVNPYAKKKPTLVGQNLSNTASSLASAPPPLLPRVPHPPPPEPPLASRRAATFSQVFESVAEDADASTVAQGAATSASTTLDPNRAPPTTAAASSSGTNSNTTTSTAANECLLHQHSHALYVSTRQKGNGVLTYIRNVPICFSKLAADFSMSSSRCALFLSCKYHDLHPDYILGRIDKLDKAFALKVLLVLVDLEDCSDTLLQLNCMAVEHNLTLILSWSEEEAARYLETLKAFDGHDASIIKKREETNFVDQVSNVLAECKGVNKTDSQQLLAQFGNFRSMVAASMDELGLVPGMGEVKVRRLYDAFHKPFSSRKATERKKRKLEAEAIEQQQLNDGFDEDDSVGETEFCLEDGDD